MDKHCPIILKKKNISKKRKDPWFDNDLHDLLRQCRRAERKWYKDRRIEDKRRYKSLEKQYSNTIRRKRKMHHSGFITDNKNNKKKLFQRINKLLGKEKSSLPHSNTDIQLADDFSQFFISKITKMRSVAS